MGVGECMAASSGRALGGVEVDVGGEGVRLVAALWKCRPRRKSMCEVGICAK